LIALIIFGNGFNVDDFERTLHKSIGREVRIVRQPLAELATEQKFLRRYRRVVKLAPDRRTPPRKSICSFEHHRPWVSASDCHGIRAGNWVLRFMGA